MLQRRPSAAGVIDMGHKLLQTAVMHAAAAAVRPLWGAYVCISIPSPLTRLSSGALQRIGVLRWGDG